MTFQIITSRPCRIGSLSLVVTRSLLSEIFPVNLNITLISPSYKLWPELRVLSCEALYILGFNNTRHVMWQCDVQSDDSKAAGLESKCTC